MDDQYTVTYMGQLLPEADTSEVISKFSILFKISTDKAENFLSSTRPKIIKTGLTSQKAGVYKKKLEEIGMLIQVSKDASHPRQERVPEPTVMDADTVSVKNQRTPIPVPPPVPPVEKAQPESAPKENPYAAPTAELVTDNNQTEILASRGKRLGASLIDGLISSAIIWPLIYFTVGFESISTGLENYGFTILWGAIGFVIFLILHGRYLTLYGQTIGKKVVGIKITDLEGSVPSFTKQILLRYGFTSLIGQVPFIGGLICLVDILFIFGAERRCLHDRVAKTMVLEA
jgi:uncharacterized RDD family membrane protein YckC